MNIRIGYYGKDENVHSTFAKCMNVLETAKYLETVAETWEDAKRYVHLIQDNMIEHWGVDGYGDPLCTRISGVQNEEALIGLFLHMKGKWHFSDNGIDWETIDEAFGSHPDWKRVTGWQAGMVENA